MMSRWLHRSSMKAFLDQEDLAEVRRIRDSGQIDRAEEILLGAEPSPAVLDELRKIASKQARQAKKTGDWAKVVYYLEGYTEYAQEWRAYCLETVNQEPPQHTERDESLLREAKDHLKA